MTHLPPTNDPRRIWQTQESENTTMTVQEIREKVRKLRSKSRREMVFNLVVGTTITALFINVFVRFVHDIYARIGWGLVVGGAFYMLGFIVYESVRTMRAEHQYDAGISSCLKYYRRILEQKRQHARHMALAAVPLVAGGIMNFLPAVAITIRYPDGNKWIRLLPFCVILGSWFALFLIMRRRLRHEFHREFKMLETLEKEFPDN